MLFSSIDAKNFFGKRLGKKVMERCQVNLTDVKEYKRSDHYSTIVGIKHYDTTDFIDYVLNRKKNGINGTKRNIALAEAFFSEAIVDMCEFGAYLSTVEALKGINPTPTIQKDKQ